MLTKQQLEQYCVEATQTYLNHISIDCVVFGFHEGQMKVLMLKANMEEAWYLPGGFVLKQEPIDNAADRILKERTGIDEIFLQQFHVFGHPDRSKIHNEMYKGMLPDELNFFNKRFISIGYYALVDFFNVNPAPDDFSEICTWRDLNDLPEFELDHELIFKTALDTLRLQLNYQPIGYNLMPKEFTMPELQKLYETILDKKLDRRNFQRRMLGFGILNKLETTRKGGAHKAPYLYSFDLENYQAALKQGLKSGW
ncbi:NUDIX hydrolase [Mucilaginibacter phyllosphaerae]|uniref:ADP-ribose pyrophosphatase YjhB (NUDIX family) n=1 Tax=Mucilaginibacter phyllosphaerae TaxID=1812349 RepID=A0A4Y8AJ26_9SPHI|nr:NUDIX domain-containing protein [Mucilaginibacter phyllosphaerae]MBB3967917.1 ADP-ribose pyrophosphatase YjhB (NUDIX family) [Mucilaginibacter phyllosphaerae]TEW69043.1 NUDIX hydrolase [Mucilaginibacter phyllosphaerae]GGH02439.1 DNA mismatch repair protein MutT [Mucilaginibacter phyllosphaerae]